MGTVSDTKGAVLGANTFTDLQTFKAGADIASATAVDLTAATGNTVVVTGTTPSTSLTMTAGQQMLLLPSGAWPMTYHATTMNINGGVDYTCAAGDRVFAVKDLAGVIRVSVIKQDGTSVVSGGAGDHSIIVHTANGYGSTNTKIRRYTTTQTSVGTAITYADSATLGASFTINEDGFYTMTALDAGSAGSATHGISLNTTAPTTNIQSIAVGERLGYVYTGIGGGSNTTVITVYLSSGDVIRPHNNGTTGNVGAAFGAFYIRKVG